MAGSVQWPMPDHLQDLGEPERIYRQDTMPKVTTILRLLLLSALLAAIGYGATKLILASGQWPEASRTCYLPIALVVLAFCALFLATPALQRYDHLKEQRRDVVVTCSDGVAFYLDGSWRQAKWNEIVEIKTQEETAGKDLM